MNSRRLSGMALTALGLAVVAWSTLRPGPASLGTLTGACCHPFDLVLNTLLFMPLGAGFVLLALRPRAAIVTGALISIGIELAQYWWIAGRFASVADVAANAVGTALGVLIVSRWDRRARWWRFVAPVLALAVVLAWVLGGPLAQPAIPGPSPWSVEWAPVSTGSAPFRGRILDLSLQGVSLPNGPIADVPGLRARFMAADTIRLAATIVTGPESNTPVPLMEIVVGERTVPFLLLVQEGQTLLAYQRLGLSWVGLRGPWMRLENALPRVAGDTAYIRLDATRRQLHFLAAHTGVERESFLNLSPELYWTALFYRATGGALWWWLVPAMASFIVLGLALAGRPKTLGLASLAALFLGPTLSGCAYPAWFVILAVVIGAIAGRRLGIWLDLPAR